MQSYATIEEADEYLKYKYGAQWCNIEDIVKTQLLVSTTRYIDKFEYQGQKVEETQKLKFPRIISGIRTDDKLVKQANIELANAGITVSLDSSGGGFEGIKSFKIGDSQIEFDSSIEQNTSNVSDILDDYLKKYKIGGCKVLL